MAEATADPPAEPAAPPPSHLEQSKSIFKQARIDVGLDKPPAEPEPPTPAEPAKTDEAPADSETPSKLPAVPDDIITGEPTPPKVHDAVAEIQAAELPKNAKKEQIDSFNKLKTKAASHLQAALDRAAELEKKANESTNKAEIEELRKAREAAEERVKAIEEEWGKVAFKESPKFKAQFASREQTAIELAKTYLDGTEIKPDIIDLAAHAVGRKRVELLKDAGVDDTVITAILPHLANFDTVQREKQAALANWKTESKNWAEEQNRISQAQKERRAQEENKVWDTVVSKTDLLPLRKSKDNTDWNNRGEQLLVQAKQIFNGDGADLPTYAQTILKGVAYDAQQEVIEHLTGRLKAAETELSKLKSATPGGVITGGTQDGKAPDTSKMSREDQAKLTFQQELAKVRS